MPILFGQHKCTSSFEAYLKKKRLKATLCNCRKWSGFTERGSKMVVLKRRKPFIVGRGVGSAASLKILLRKDSQAINPKETTQIEYSPGALLRLPSGLL